MSIQAKLLRLVVRPLFKWANLKSDIASMRRRLDRIKWIVPRPPTGTQVARVTAFGVPGVSVATARSRQDCHVLYLHGGAYVYGSPLHYRDFIWRIADATAAHVLCVDYRLAPEHPFPAAVDDAVSAYRWLLAEGADPRRTAVMGDSAGGGLTYAMLLKLRDDGIPLPAVAAALSPWTDLALTGQSLRLSDWIDPMISTAQARLFADAYLSGVDPKTPYASPLFGDPAGLPPSLIQVGSDEILRDDAERMAERLRCAGCAVELQVWPHMPHVWQLFARILPEGRQAIERIGEFVRLHFAAS
jgi:monoterpene epsilon-lactone hydrolase